jgi:hypothetical protein
MARGACDPQGGHLGFAAFDPSGRLASVQSRLDPPSRRCRGGANEADDDLPAHQRRATPGGRDGAEHAVRDRVPLARARGPVADPDAQTAVSGEALQCPLPQPCAGAVAAATVGGEQPCLGLRRHGRAHLEPPGPDRRDRDGRRVMVHADADPADVGVPVVDPLRDRLAQRRVDDVIDA